MSQKIIIRISITLFLIFAAKMVIVASENELLSVGQMLYVPAYSHIYIGNKERPFLLTITLSIRNINEQNNIEITQVDYFESQGHLLKKMVRKSVIIKPLESIRYVIPENDSSGGSGANFIVKWKSNRKVNPPIVESIMIGTMSQQGISFTSRGKEIQIVK